MNFKISLKKDTETQKESSCWLKILFWIYLNVFFGRSIRNRHFPGSTPIKCLLEAWVFREHWFVRWRKPHSHQKSHSPPLVVSPLDWDLLLKANRYLNWLSSAGELSVLCGCLALWSSVKPGPAANFLVRMDLSFYIAGVSHLFTPNMNAIHLETIVFMSSIWLHHFYESLSTALSVSNKLTLNVLRNKSQFEIWGSYFEAISYPLVPKLTL